VDAGVVAEPTDEPKRRRPVRRVLARSFMIGGFPARLARSSCWWCSRGRRRHGDHLGRLRVLMIATQLIYGFAALDRRWIRLTLGIEIPTPMRPAGPAR